MFRKVLIANRGEIALRIARACRELGVPTVAVHSTADRDSAVVSYADESVHIGPDAATASYLSIPAVVAAAHHAGADAVHPGYGFLAENPDLAQACADSGLAFVGPPADVLARLGDKIAARELMAGAGVPVLPGSTGEVATVQEAHRVAAEVGYPVMVKAAAGGGGRGVRVVHDRGELAAAFHETRARARDLFGDHRVFVERFLAGGRHVEVQVLADGFGNAVHVGERDCSVQRRYQKLIEESPAPRLPDGLAERMGAAAVRGARAAGYVGAGTVEFLVDRAGAFAFLEVNCRIQVEHPVTEMVSGLDLVAEQLRIAAGEPLRLRQADLAMRGVAIECRINAEDPGRDFVPTPGTLTEFVPPGGPFVRVDTHGFPGYRIPAAYDSLLAKLIVWGASREQALRRMDRALEEFRIGGVHTTVGVLRKVIGSPEFQSGHYDTAIVNHLFGKVPAHGSNTGG
jgi:acetyl-CoA carboxylase, biotin carboxylase subunit